MKENNKSSYEGYKDFLKNIICDKNIESEILEQLKRFYDEGVLIFCGRDLCGKIRNIEGNDYLEIKYTDDFLICSYTKYNFRKKVNIFQNKINDVFKVERKENSVCFDSLGHTESQNVELEKIYDDKFNLLYESLLTDNSCGCFSEQLKYEDKSSFLNKLCLNRKWYFDNGSVVYYKFHKNFVSLETEIKESYSICVNPYNVNYVMVYDLEPLSEELFKKLMLNEITIENVIDEIKKQKVKIKEGQCQKV